MCWGTRGLCSWTVLRYSTHTLCWGTWDTVMCWGTSRLVCVAVLADCIGVYTRYFTHSNVLRYSWTVFVDCVAVLKTHTALRYSRTCVCCGTSRLCWSSHDIRHSNVLRYSWTCTSWGISRMCWDISRPSVLKYWWNIVSATHIHEHTHTHTHKHTHKNTHTNTHTRICTGWGIYRNIYVCICTYIYTCVCRYTADIISFHPELEIHVYIYIYIII